MRLFNLAMQIGLCLGSEINQTDPLENWTVALKTNLTLFSDTWKLILTLGLCTHCSLCLECFSLELLAHNSNIDSNVGMYKRWSLIAPPHSFVSVLLSPQYFPLPETILSIDLLDYLLIINPLSSPECTFCEHRYLYLFCSSLFPNALKSVWHGVSSKYVCVE